MSGCDSKLINELMDSLSNNGEYEVSQALIEEIQKCFDAGCCDEESVAATIKSNFDENHYLLDTHTAVAVKVYEEYVKANNILTNRSKGKIINGSTTLENRQSIRS